MSCNCETYTCVEAMVDPCNVGTSLPIAADETGTWTAQLLFNGVWRQFGVSVIDGETIAILTKLFNENYTHELRLLRVNGTLFGCFHVKSMLSIGVSDAPVPAPGNNTWQWATVTATGGNTVQSNLWKGVISPIIWINSTPINWADAGITQNATTGTLDFAAVSGVSGFISFQYKDLP